MIRSFRNEGTEAIFNGVGSAAARRACPPALWKIAARKLDQIDSAERLDDLRVPPGNRLEALTGDRRGTFSIRVNERYRICFRWETDGAHDMEIVDYH